ncbi:reactive intermediate/imine deaminase [Steroidobacter agaridevorans]|uniref:Reactive intermediate/imine deaminase n=1 Tax=Steroidobacter agaridevorans TaxID=2695856 RepID=A0A829Y6G4_9GAMM|nr:Rid family detoxifying hydrolase [Steroidobacter agaridevorans]GFE78396.1 reactive intermediate/imine deaminase [Steroidobacter agaridevorans]GFE89672.1 reactive intermediate/imine deaminase [Steroidobacter agaridevorans]
MAREIIATPNAPKAIGTYSQAVKVGKTVYVSGQIALDPATGEMVQTSIDAEIRRVFDNLKAIVGAAGGNFSQVTRATVFILDFGVFPTLNKIMAEYFAEPYPSRVTVQVSALPKNANVEIDCIVELD